MKHLTGFFLILCLALSGWTQKVPYGNNPEAGAHFDVKGTQLYYEVYGQGSPLLLLHGGVYGYIDEFEALIPKLAESHRVICLATRGHGKSELGHEPITWAQRARDAKALIDHLQIKQVIAVGFSDGAAAALKLAALYPANVSKVIAMGIGDQAFDREEASYSEKSLMEQAGQLFEGRKQLMPEPDRWDESLQMINKLYNQDHLSQETFSKISQPVLLINGEGDEYYSLKAFESAHKQLANSQKEVIKGCGHVILYCKFLTVWNRIADFLEVPRHNISFTPDLSAVEGDKSWYTHNRELVIGKEIHLNAQEGDGMFIKTDYPFADGTIEFELKGKNERGRSFVGIAFHIRGLEAYDAIYFRPFNFKDPERNTHAVQYVSHPEYGWRKLREEHPGTYENALSPAPDPEAWLKVKVAIHYPQVKVFINGSSVPCLEVEQLQAYQEGPIGFWVGNNSEGYFRNLKVTPE